MIKLLQSQNDLLKEWQEWKNIFLTCLIINLLAYGCYLINITYATDDYFHIFRSSEAIVSGRWVIDFLHNFVFRTSLMPTILPILCIVFNILTGTYMCKLWSVGKVVRFLVVALWTTHPYLLDMYNFRVTAIAYSVGYFLTIIALYASGRGKIGGVLSVILLYFALSIYQPVIGFAIAAIMVQVLLIVFRENFSSESIHKCVKILGRYALFLAVSVISYLVITKLLNICLDVNVNSRLEAGFISDFDQIKAKIAVIFSVFIVRLGPVKEFVLPFAGKLGIFIIYLAAMLAVIKKAHRPWAAVAALLWIGLIPLGAVCFILPLEALSMSWRICMGLVVFFAGMFALTQESELLMIRRTGIAIAAFLVGYFILNNNTVLYKQHLTNHRDLITGNRIIAKMQSLDGYQPGMELAIVGHVQKETFSKEGKGNVEIIREYIKYCSVRRYSLAKSAFETDWSKYAFLLNYMNLELKRASPANREKAAVISQGRKPWPDPSSIFIRDDLAVLILSLPDE